MTRSEFDDIRAYIAAEANHAGDLLRVARNLLDDLEHARMREANLRTHYLRLLTAARAAIAAQMAGDGDPLTFLQHELGAHGQLPGVGEGVNQVLSDARSASEMVAALEPAPPRTAGPRLRRCVGASRTLPG
ncbi:hypothetical protein SAMN05421505_109229 [Sinosporangium album]|uniref:Uncharacterized protein n=1 Tax=Sinosporangium album TaxID=504805 RepID=A0A1G7YH42_9ACTN|nr:hypothetical protein [Sinosporangium album]SDG95190.1 hypothetical protein SAMN05421505_109229 [Sinosporangium album]